MYQHRPQLKPENMEDWIKQSGRNQRKQPEWVLKKDSDVNKPEALKEDKWVYIIPLSLLSQ